MSSSASLPLYGFDPDDLANNAIQWFVKSVARRAMAREPLVNAVLFAVARIVRDGKTRCEYAFVLSEDPITTWPLASSPNHNAMLKDGRSQHVITQCLRDLYGADSVELGQHEGGAFYRAFARFARGPMPPETPLASAFAPIVLLSRPPRNPDPLDTLRFRSDSSLRATLLAFVQSPECEDPRPAATSDDPRHYLSPIEICALTGPGDYLIDLLIRWGTVREQLTRFRAEPNTSNLQALRKSLGIREDNP